MRSLKKWLLPCLCLLWMLVIWQFSLAPAEESAAESAGVQEILNEALESAGVPLQLTSHAVRKAAHFTEFFLLGVLSLASARSLSLPFFLSFLSPVLTAAADETIQRFVPGRAGQIKDVLLDLAGACTGILLLLLILCAVRYLRGQGTADGVSDPQETEK